MRRSPPTSTLFPYTTLFRSADQEAQAAEVVRQPADVEPVAELLEQRPRLLRVEAGKQPLSLPFGDEGRDRKSTRLNSSHLGISYAVFCLKKKTIYKRTTDTS